MNPGFESCSDFICDLHGLLIRFAFLSNMVLQNKPTAISYLPVCGVKGGKLHLSGDVEGVTHVSLTSG